MPCDLVLEIGPGAKPGEYRVEVESPAGAAEGTALLDVALLLDRRRELAATVLASSAIGRGAADAHEMPVRAIGEALFAAVFANHVYGRYTASVHEAVTSSESLRFILRLRAPELAGLPWEALFDPEARSYLCQREPVVRFVDVAQAPAPLLVEPPLRILGLVAAPRDLEPLDVDAEKQRLTDALGGLQANGHVELVWAEHGSWAALQSMLIEGPWHVVHFIGHGGVDESGQTGVLALENADGGSSLVSAERFARLLGTARPVPRLVVLNSCHSGESAAADDLLSSTAASLVHSGTNAAVAMQFAITDTAALAFSGGFYQALAHDRSVEEAVRIGRIAIDGTSERTLEWLTPVLYSRTRDTRLFAVKRAGASEVAPVAAPPIEIPPIDPPPIEIPPIDPPPVAAHPAEVPDLRSYPPPAFPPPAAVTPELLELLPGDWQVQIQIPGIAIVMQLRLFPNGIFHAEMNTPNGYSVVDGQWQADPFTNQIGLSGQQKIGFGVGPYMTAIQLSYVDMQQLVGVSSAGESVTFQRVGPPPMA